MYVRGAKNREEVWLLDRIEELGLDDTAFRSRDYVVAIDEESGEKAGFGRIRIHKGDEECCELTSIGVLPAWREQGVGAHVIERLIDHATDEQFDRVYALTDQPEYLAQFGFRRIEESALPAPLVDRLDAKQEGIAPEAVPSAIDVDRFRMPDRFRERFKRASSTEDDEDGPTEGPEDFGIDPDEATYKYDV